MNERKKWRKEIEGKKIKKSTCQPKMSIDHSRFKIKLVDLQKIDEICHD